MMKCRFFPVVLAVPDENIPITGREKTAFLSEWARKALGVSADMGGYDPGPLKKNDKGAPEPTKGIFWSITHKPLYVGGVCAHVPVGIDVERIRDFHRGLYDKSAVEKEWDLLGGKGVETFFRMWTAKESVLKKEGTGVFDLLKCRLSDVSDNGRMILDYRGTGHEVRHKEFDGHIAAVSTTLSGMSDEDGLNVEWKIIKAHEIFS